MNPEGGPHGSSWIGGGRTWDTVPGPCDKRARPASGPQQPGGVAVCFVVRALSIRIVCPIVSTTATATLGGGCFWCLEAVYQEVDGVESVVSGYAGGDVSDPSYQQVCTGSTGHAEVVQLEYDPTIIGYRDLLEIFFTIHNPTTKDQEGPDVGSQYRSIILHHSEEQKETAQSLIEDLEAEGVFPDPIVTEVEPLETFYPAEEKHQNYYRSNPSQPYCQSVISPKVSKLRKKHAGKLQG